MKKTVLIFGLVMGAIFAAGTIYMSELLFYKNPEIKSNDFLGYVVMVVIYSLIFIGIRNYRNHQLKGMISFKKAFKTGTMITVIASTLYVIICLVYLYRFAPDYMDKYTEYVLRHTAPSEQDAKMQAMENLKTMYKNPFFVILFTYAEILPIGLVVTLISSLILKKKAVKADSENGIK